MTEATKASITIPNPCPHPQAWNHPQNQPFCVSDRLEWRFSLTPHWVYLFEPYRPTFLLRGKQLKSFLKLHDKHGSFPQVGVKSKNIWNHHLDKRETEWELKKRPWEKTKMLIFFYLLALASTRLRQSEVMFHCSFFSLLSSPSVSFTGGYTHKPTQCPIQWGFTRLWNSGIQTNPTFNKQSN